MTIVGKQAKTAILAVDLITSLVCAHVLDLCTAGTAELSELSKLYVTPVMAGSLFPARQRTWLCKKKLWHLWHL